MNPVIDKIGSKRWYNAAGEFHRLHGPAVECANGNKYWLNGKRHREDGPAIELADGNKYWYLYGEEQTITHEDPRWEILISKMRKLNKA